MSSEASQKTEQAGRTSGKTPGKRVHSKDADMGAALRSVYQKTVDETVPPEMLDLLGKLG